jgi:hypothetical protein
MFLLHYVRIPDQTTEQVSHYIHVFAVVLVLLPWAPIVPLAQLRPKLLRLLQSSCFQGLKEPLHVPRWADGA